MAIPRADSNISARVKKLEDEVRRIKLMPSVSQAAVAPLAVAKSSVWYDTSAGNEPKYYDGTAWVPVRDTTIAVAQTAADTAQAAVDPLVPLTDIAGMTTGTTITGATLPTSGSGARVVINDPAYPGQIVLYTDDPDEIEPARLYPVISGNVAYLRIVGPKVVGMTGIPSTIDIEANTATAERQSTIDVDRFNLFSSFTKIDGYSSLKLGDGTDYLDVVGSALQNANLAHASNVFPASITNPPVVFAATASGNFVKPTSPAAKTHLVEIWGPGAAGGGVAGGTGEGEGAGGGGGGYVRKRYTDAELSASEAFVIGTGGAGVSGAAGGAGSGSSTFKSLVAGAGAGGAAMTVGTVSAGANQGNGGVATGGDVNSPGGDGGKGRRNGSFVNLANYGGPAGGPGAGPVQYPNFGAGVGAAGKAAGCGGSGAYGSGATSQAGGAGQTGKIIITSEY